MTIYRADMLSAQQNFILRRNLQVSFEQEKERFGCKERKSFVNTEMLVFIIEKMCIRDSNKGELKW